MADDFLYIDTPPALESLCAHLKGKPWLAVDTEFMREKTYYPELCLVQVADNETVACVDPLALPSLVPLLEVLLDERTVKVLHAARQDLEIFFHLTGKVPSPVFDTQVAARFLGLADQAGYGAVVQALLGISLDKSHARTDWARRPLTERQVTYALSDVTHLRPTYEKLMRRIAKTGRASWVDEEMAVLTNPATYRQDPREAWRRLKVRSEKPRLLAVLREVAAWREEEAQRRNLPRSRIIKDETVVEIAAHAPTTIEDLGHSRGVSRGQLEGRQGAAILAAVRAGLAVPEAECPKPDPRPDLPGGLAPIVELLRVLLKTKCEAHEVAQKLVASAADLDLIAASDDAAVPAMTGWRRELFGDDALALKRGRIALSVAGKRVKIVTLEPVLTPSRAASAE